MISIEDFIHIKAKDSKINISSVCEDALRMRLEIFEQKVLPKDCKHSWTNPFSVSAGLMKECKLCGEFKRVYIENSKVGSNE